MIWETLLEGLHVLGRLVFGERPVRINMPLPCGRCGQPVLADEADVCWYCYSALCHECWDTVGHCGHEEADRINAIAVKFLEQEHGYIRR